MTTFDRREEAFENLFAHDEETHFKAESRRARLMAGWAGALLGRSGADLDAYATAIINFTVEQGGAPALVAKIREDLRAGGVTVSDAEIHQRMATFMAEALRRVRTA